MHDLIACQRDDKEMLKILSWNIQQGGGSRVLKITSQLTAFGADIIALSEYKNNDSGLKIRSALLSAGYRFQIVANANSGDNSAAIFSKLPCNSLLFPNSDEDYPHNVVAAEYDAFRVYSMYLPHKKKHKLFDFLITEAKKPMPGILVGDYNSGKNYIDQKGKSFWYEDKLIELERLDYVDAFREVKGQVKEYSWYSHQGNGYRYDHTYLDKTLVPIIKDCYYLHEWRENKLSDHSPMVLELG